MQQKRLVFLFSLIFLLIGLPSFHAQETHHMVLLAVQESANNTFYGSTADLYLEIQPGKGRVFLETFPATKIDTQISTRFAKEMVCSYLNFDCSQYDFIYTIKASSPIVGGPSASAAIATLTASALTGLDLDEKISITGTINSGATIGPVGGLKEKIDAAARGGLKTVIIPAGTKITKLPNNDTLDLQEYAKKEFSVKILEAGDLGEAIFYFTGKTVKEEAKPLEKNQDYQKIMASLNQDLCQRGKEIEKESLKYSLNSEEMKGVEEKWNRSIESSAKEDFYSAASFCFGANVELKQLLLKKQNLTLAEINPRISQLESNAQKFKELTKNQKIKTISDLQTHAIVSERINEVKRVIQEIREVNNTNQTSEQMNSLAYAEERFYSALSWSQFFVMLGKDLDLTSEKLSKVCMEKLSESRERFQYVTLFLPPVLVETIQEDINEAETALGQNDFPLCLEMASQSKARADALISILGVEETALNVTIDNKLKSAGRVISEAVDKEAFPLSGYSYYQYAKTLRDSNPQAAMLYAEYALELSNLDIYFEKKVMGNGNGVNDSKFIFFTPILNYLFGLASGITICLVIGFLSRRKSKKGRNKKRKD